MKEWLSVRGRLEFACDLILGYFGGFHVLKGLGNRFEIEPHASQRMPEMSLQEEEG